MKIEADRRSKRNLPYPENETCLDVGCFKYGRSCVGADATGEQCDGKYCRDRILNAGPEEFLRWKAGYGCPICGELRAVINTEALEHFLGHIFEMED